jgi:hypothetical protein
MSELDLYDTIISIESEGFFFIKEEAKEGRLLVDYSGSGQARGSFYQR